MCPFCGLKGISPVYFILYPCSQFDLRSIKLMRVRLCPTNVDIQYSKTGLSVETNTAHFRDPLFLRSLEVPKTTSRIPYSRLSTSPPSDSSSSKSSSSLSASVFSINPNVALNGNPTTLSKLPSIRSTRMAPIPCIP